MVLDIQGWLPTLIDPAIATTSPLDENKKLAWTISHRTHRRTHCQTTATPYPNPQLVLFLRKEPVRNLTERAQEFQQMLHAQNRLADVWEKRK